MRASPTVCVLLVFALASPGLGAEPKTVLTLKDEDDEWAHFTAAISADGKLLAAHTLRRLRIISLPDGKVLQTAKNVSIDRGEDHQLLFSPDGKRVAFMHDRPHVMDVASGRIRKFDDLPLRIAVHPLLFTRDSRNLVTTDMSGVGPVGVVIFYDVETGKPIRRAPTKYDYGLKPPRIVLSPDDKLCALDGGVDRADGEIEVHELAMRGKATTLKGGSLVGFLPDNRSLLTVSWSDRTIHQVDTRTGKVTNTATAHDLSVFVAPPGGESKEDKYQVRLSPDGSKLAVTSVTSIFEKSSTRWVRVFDTRTGKTLAAVREEPTVKGKLFALRGLTFAADGKSVSYVRAGPTAEVRTLPLDDPKGK